MEIIEFDWQDRIILTGQECKISHFTPYYAIVTNETAEDVYLSKRGGIADNLSGRGIVCIGAGQTGYIAVQSGTESCFYALGSGSIAIRPADSLEECLAAAGQGGTAGVNPNLLINPDFRINQRSASGTITEAGYFVDRWQLVSGSVTVNADKSLTLDGTIKQVLESPVGAEVRASASAGAASYDDSTKTFTLSASGKVITWAKLEVGTEATRFSPPDTASELAKCQRFGFVWDAFVRYHSAYTTGTQHTFVIPTPVPLRVSPTINGGLTFFKALSPTAANVIADQTYSVVGGVMSSNFCLRATTAEAYEWVMVGAASSGTFVDAEIH